MGITGDQGTWWRDPEHENRREASTLHPRISTFSTRCLIFQNTNTCIISVSLECFRCSSWIKWCSINNGNAHSYSPNLAFLWHWSIMQIQETSISFLLLFWWINMRKKNLTYRCFFFPLISWHSQKVSLQLQEGQECLQIVQLFSM